MSEPQKHNDTPKLEKNVNKRTALPEMINDKVTINDSLRNKSQFSEFSVALKRAATIDIDKDNFFDKPDMDRAKVCLCLFLLSRNVSFKFYC